MIIYTEKRKVLELSFSIVDYLGVIDFGVGVLLSLRAGENIYEMVYWFNVFGDYRVVCDDDFLELIGVNSIYEFKYFNELVKKIEESLPDKAEILYEFGVIRKKDEDIKES